jgi:hypothetical protein
MKPFLVGITRLSGSVKLRCALWLGSAVTGLDLRPGRPLPPSPRAVVVRLRGDFGFGFSFQRGLGGTDLLSRFSLLAIHSGISSPRFEAPN